MQLILAELQRDLKVKQDREHAQNVSASGISVQSSGVMTTAAPSSTPLALVPAILQTPSFSGAASGVFPPLVQDPNAASVSISKTGRPFVHIKVPQTVPEQTALIHLPQVASKDHIAATTASSSLHMLQTVQSAIHTAKDSQVVEDLYSVQTNASSSQQLSHRALFSRLSAEPGKFSAQPKTSTPAVSGNSRSSMTKATNETVPSESSFNHLSQPVGLFQLLAPPQTEASQNPSGASQMFSIYPQTSLQIQPLPLPVSTSAQNIQFQLVSPLIIGQPNLMIPLNQPGAMSFILQNSATDSAQDSQSFLQAPPPFSSSSIPHRDFVISHVSPMQNFPASTLSDSCEALRNKSLSTCPSQTQCNLTISNSTGSIQLSKSDNISASSNLGVKVNTEAVIQNLQTNLDNFSDSAEPNHDIPFEYQTNRNSMAQDDSSSAHNTIAAVVHFQGIQTCGQEGELLHQVSNIDQYFPSALLNPAAGTSLFEVTSSSSSSSFVFDALAESPVKESLSSPSLHPVPIVTSSLLCEMLMSPVVSSVSATLSLTTSTTSQMPVYTMNSMSCGSVKPSLQSSLKSCPSTSAYCQSINFSTHTTPSLSTQPVVMASKVEQTSLPIAVTIGHNASLSHSQISVSRLNRQRDPPQVGIVHPHVSGGKSSLGDTVNSHAYSSASSLMSQNSVYSSPVSVTSVAAANILGESHSSALSSGSASVINSNVQLPASVQELSADNFSNQSHPQQQQLLLSLLLNSQTANKTLINIPQASQFNLSTLLGNPGSSMTNTVAITDSHKRQTNHGSQNEMNICDYHVNPHNVPNPSLQNILTDNGNFLQSQTPLSMGSLMPVSIASQNIVSGSVSTQLCDPHMLYSNTGQVKLVPVILSDGSHGGSAQNLFSQNGQLLLNVSPCAGLGGVSSISPQGLNRDSSFLLNLSPNSGQSKQLQHQVVQIEDIAQNISALPLASSSAQNIQHSREASLFSKDQTHAVQASVLPFTNQHADSQLMAQVEPHRDSNLSQSMSSKESLCTKNFENKMSIYALPSTLRPAVGAVPTQKLHSDLFCSQPILDSTETAQNMYRYDSQSGENSCSGPNVLIACNLVKVSSSSETQNMYGYDSQSGENSSSGPNVLISCNLVKVSRSSETPHKIAEVARTASMSLPTSSLAEAKSTGFAKIAVSEQQNLSVDSVRENRNKSQVYLTQTSNEHEDQQSLLLPTQLAARQLQPTPLAAQQLQLPLQVVSVVQNQAEQTSSDRLMASNVGTSFVLGQPGFQNFGLRQQLHSLLGMTNTNQIFLPIQSVPFSSHSGPGESTSKLNQELQLPQQLSELPKLTSLKTVDANSSMPATQTTKNVHTHLTCTSMQSAVANSGPQLANIVTSGSSSNKHRPIRPKLHPIPTPASNISLMLVPDKPGYPAYQLTQVDSTSLPLQPVSVQPTQSQLTSQHPHNVILNQGASLQKQNSLSIAGTSSQQQSLPTPLVNAAFLTQLQLNQQPNVPAQILLLSQSDISQRSQNSETQAIIGHQNEILTLPSEQVNTNIHAVPLEGTGCRISNQKNDAPEMISQHLVSIQPGMFQMTSDRDTSGLPLLQNEALKFSSTFECESFELKPFESKVYPTGVFSNESVFVNTPQGTFSSDGLRSETFEASSLQSSGFNSGSQQNLTVQFGCSETNVPECSTSQTAVSQVNSLSLESSQIIPVQQVVQTDIQRLNPQIASQLSSGDSQRLAYHNLVHVNTTDELGELVIMAYKGSQILQVTQPEGHYQTATHPNVTPETAASSAMGADMSAFTHSEHLTADLAAQPGGNNNRRKVAVDVRDFSRSTVSNAQKHEVKTSCGSHYSTTLISNHPVASSELPVYTQFSQNLTQSSALMADVKIIKGEDIKPVLSPIQYLQCKEVIDLTEDDSPFLSPNSIATAKGKTMGLVPILSNHTQIYEKQFSNNQISGQQHSINVKGSQYVQQWGQVKQESKEMHGALHDNVLINRIDESEFPSCSSIKKELGPNVLKLEEIPEDIRQALFASLESHAVANPDVHLVTKAFTSSNDLSYHSVLSLRDHVPSVAEAADKNSSPRNAMMSSNQQVEQPLDRPQSQLPPAVAVSNSKFGATTHSLTENKKLSQTCRQGTSRNPSPDLSSLSAVKLTGPLKQEKGLAFTFRESAVSTTSSLSSDVTALESLNQSSSNVVSATSTHKLAGVTSCPPLLPRSPVVKAPLSRTVIHPLTSSAVAFMRTNNTPTEAVGPPNITIMSSAQANTSPHLRLRHEKSVSITTAASNPLIITSVSPKPVSTMARNFSSRLLNINSITSVSTSVRAQGKQDVKISELPCSAPEGKDKATSQSGRRLSFENSFPVKFQKLSPATESSSPSLPVGGLLKPPEAVTPSRPKGRKKPSTIMDLLKNKERLQATAALSSSVFPVNSATGPLTFMISGTSDLLLMEPSAAQAGMSLSTMNIAVRNLHLMDKLTNKEDTKCEAKQVPLGSQPSGFAVLQPNVLPSLSGSCNITSTSAHITAVTATVQPPSSAAVSGSSISQVQSQVAVSMDSCRSHKTSTSAVKAVNTAGDSSFTASMLQPDIHADALAQSVTLSSQFSAGFYKSRGLEVSGKGCSASREAFAGSPSATIQGFDCKHSPLQESPKYDTEVQFQPVGQPQVACGTLNKDKSVVDFLIQKPHAESFSGEKLKFKTTTTRNTGSGDRQQEFIRSKFRLLEETQSNLPSQNTGTIKKLLLLNEKSAGESSEVHSGSLLRSSIQISDNSQYGSTNEKHLAQKAPQLLQLMKSKEQFSYTDFEPAVNAKLSESYTDFEPAVNVKLSHSSGHDKRMPLKLQSSIVSMPVSGDDLVYDYSSSSASTHLSYHQPKEDFKRKDQLHVFKTESPVSVLQPKEYQMGLLEANGNIMAVEASPDSRMNMLTSQHPLISSILFQGDSNSAPLQTLPSDSGSKSSMHFESQLNSFRKKRSYTEGSSYNNEHTVLGQQTSPNQIEHPHGSQDNKMSFETEDNVSGLSNLTNRAPPAYNHQTRYETPKKDMTRVNRVIEDIYKFPDEGEEPSPPPVFAGLKSHKFTYNHRWQERSAGSSASFPQSSESIQLSVASNKKSSPKIVQNTSGNSTTPSPSKSYTSSHVAGNSAQTWRNPKKLKAKRDQDRSNCKINLKKVQFSDVVTSKSVPDYGQSNTVNSGIGSLLLGEVASHRRDKEKCPAQDYSIEDGRKLLGKHQRLEKDRQDNHIVYEKHPYTAGQLETEFREGKLRTYHSVLTEAPFTRPENLQMNIKAKGSKTVGLNTGQRETDTISDFEDEHQFGREEHKVFQQQHFAGVSRTTLTADGEQKFKQRGDKDIDPFQTLRQAHENPCTFQSGFVQESSDSICSFVNERNETGRMHHIQHTVKSCEQSVTPDTYEGMSSQCENVVHSTVEETRDLLKRRHTVLDENLQFSADPDHEVHPFERNNFMTDKKEFDLPSANVATANCERDSTFHQQSSFNILSTQGYSKLSRQRLHRADADHMWAENLTSAPFKPQDNRLDETSGTSAHYEDRDFPYQIRCEALSVGSESSNNVERQPSESPLTRQKILESNFEIARQMKKGHVHILKDSKSEISEGRKMESPQKFFLHPDRSEDISGSQMQRDTESEMSKELEYRTPTGPANKLTSPIFSNTLDGRPDVLTSLESLSCLRKEIKDLRGLNHYLKLEVARAEQKGKEQQRQRRLSTSDKQRAMSTEVEKDKCYYTSSSSTSSQSYMADTDNVTPMRKRHTSSTTALGALNYSLFQGSEQAKTEEGFQSKVCQLSLGSSGIQQMLDSEISFQDGSHRVSAAEAVYARGSINIDDSPEHYIRDTKDPLVSSSMSSYSRPTSQLDLGIQYELPRHKYPFSEVKSGPLRSISDGDGFVPLEHTRHRNLSSSLGFHALSDVDPPPYELTQRQRNPSASSLKSTFQEADILNFDMGARSRNPSSSSWIRYLDYSTDFAIIRSRNPSGSSNRRSRPGSSSSSEREHPVNVDELPLFSDIAHTRSRNSSGESIEPTLDLILDPQQFMQYTQYTYQSAEAHSKRTKH